MSWFEYLVILMMFVGLFAVLYFVPRMVYGEEASCVHMYGRGHTEWICKDRLPSSNGSFCREVPNDFVCSETARKERGEE